MTDPSSPPFVPLIALMLLPLGVALGADFLPAARGPVAAVFPPWWSESHSFAAAGRAGAVLRFGALPFIVIVDSENRDLLTDAGAWLLLAPRALSDCRPSSSSLNPGPTDEE